MNKLRNIGIVAHINAGKTTTTERILYHSGSTKIVGDVDKGNTVTDYLVQERDRGITITSAAVTYDWKKHRVNLIDTPGHVDFTVEVERSLSVIDGVVTILDSSAGVEAQTITVWNQAKKYRLSNVIFLNKYDKPSANFKACMNDLKECFETLPCLIQLPIKDHKTKNLSILDIIKRTHTIWVDPEHNNGSEFISKSIFDDDSLDKNMIERAEEHREILINSLTDCDDEFANHVVDCDRIAEVKTDELESALRRATLNCAITPVLIGSSFKYIGVQQLMDSIIKYLPGPEEREQYLRLQMMNSDVNNHLNSNPQMVSNISGSTCGFIFKILHDQRLGPLSFMKICDGSLKKQQKLKNITTSHVEQTKLIYRAFADEMNVISEPIVKHDIVAVSGLTQSRTGDILVDLNLNLKTIADPHSNPLKGKTTSVVDTSQAWDYEFPFMLLNNKILVPRIRQLEPVYHCSIESRKISEQLKLEKALACLSREDPSFRYEIDQHGITTIRGMGKLHLEIIRDRIQSEYKIDPLLGPLQISYRETIKGSATEELVVNRLINSINNRISIKLHVCPSSKQNSSPWSAKMLRLDSGPDADASLTTLRHDHRKAIEQGLESALAHGPIFGYPMIDCDIMLVQFQANSRCALPVISSAASQCLMNALKRCSPLLMEPISLVEVIVPRDHNGTILGDLNQRRAHILVSIARENGTILTRALVPLSSLNDYSEFIRINTSGRGTFSMQLNNYSPMSESDKIKHNKQV